MSAPAATPGAPVTSKDDLVAYFTDGFKPRSEWRLGTEHEKFLFHKTDLRPPSYEEAGGVRDLLTEIARFGWRPVYEGETVIALKREDGSNISLEPAGQFELSGAPLENVHDTCSELHRHLAEVSKAAGALGLGSFSMGMHPICSRSDMPWMPKNRYKIMRDYMPTKGKLGLDMMQRTCTVQVNMDFSSEADMRNKLQVSLALQPVATALFSSSPFLEGKPNGFKSYRAHIWTDTDPDRTGDLPIAFESNFSFEQFTDHALNVPMYFIARDGQLINCAGQSFRDFMNGRLKALPGETPLITDWADHISTLFTEVRLKRFLEMRGADGGDSSMVCALSAFWAGLLYDGDALAEALELIKPITSNMRRDMTHAAAKDGLAGRWQNADGQDMFMQDLAKRAVQISESGLKARGIENGWGVDERKFLIPLQTMAEAGASRADRMLERYHGTWNTDLTPLFCAEMDEIL